MAVIDLIYVRKQKSLTEAAERAARERKIQVKALEEMLRVRDNTINRLCKALDYARAVPDDEVNA